MWYVIIGVGIAMIGLTIFEMFSHMLMKIEDVTVSKKIKLFVFIAVFWPAIVIALLVMPIKDDNY